ncbi:MAG: glycerol-3-phosphate acyltransferase [Bacteroidetes bacterium]|nr:glycerol-3-phosphate acyltransferase [Bacteroidota bacterium]MBU2584424.1 glycerol-3-phosphate acyltransferase [Bacteroidota bacterium]
MNYLVIAVISYLIGSIPTAYILLKRFRSVDIRNEGSGNVGGHNAYEVSKSKWIGGGVAVTDFLKGLIAVFIAKQIDPQNFILIGIAALFAVIGHCFSVWIGFHGGRGLATTAGATILFLPFTAIIWGVLWLIVYLKFKNIHLGNIWATIFTFIIIILSSEILINYSYPQPGSNWELYIISFLVLSIIFFKHLEPMKEIFRKRVKAN